MANDFIVPLDCATPWSTIEDINENCPEIGDLSEVKYLFLADGLLTTAQIALLLPLWTNPVDWAAAIDNQELLGAKIKQLLGIGSVTTAAPTVREMPARKKAFGTRTSTLVFKMLSLTDNLITFLRRVQSSGVTPYIWFVTTGGKMYGAPTGIVSSSKDVSFNLASGSDSYEDRDLTITWDAIVEPDRIATPV